MTSARAALASLRSWVGARVVRGDARGVRLARGAGERGSISVWAVSGAFAMILLVGLAVDLGGKVYAMQHARDVARQAARAGGQAVYGPAAIRGEELRVDPAAARAAAQAHLSRAGMTGTVTVDGTGQRIRVTTHDTYDTVFLPIIGINSFSVSGDAESRVTRSVDGVER